MLKKIFIAVLLLLLISALFIFIAVFATGPSLPAVTEGIIAEVMNSEVSDDLPGETGFADSSGIWIWYKSIKPAGVLKGNILLVAGLAADTTWWPPCFVKELIDAGYRVILFDNRSTGLSDWMKEHENWRYTIADMAKDGIAVLNKLGIREAHIIGVSMGGMVAQEFAISYPERVKSLVSLMSSAYPDDPELPRVPWKTVRGVIRLGARYGMIKNEKNIIKLHLAVWQLFRNETLSPDDLKSISRRVLFNIRGRRGYNTLALPQQLDAIIVSGSRYDRLGNVRKPSLFIHGRRDPLIPYQHGVKCSHLVKGSSLMLMENMGHDIPCSISGKISGGIIKFISAVK